VELKLAERQGVEIDYCPECRGIWLDRGELDKIIERSYSQQPAYTQPEPQPVYQPQQQQPYPHNYDRHHDKHGYGHQGSHQNGHHGRKSWLAELFD
jgi:Zn-finger nucleic acid-binding protein